MQLAAVNYNLPTEVLSTFGTSKSQQSLDRSPQSSIHEGDNHYTSSSTVRAIDSKEHLNDLDEKKANGAPWIRRPNSPANSEEK